MHKYFRAVAAAWCSFRSFRFLLPDEPQKWHPQPVRYRQVLFSVQHRCGGLPLHGWFPDFRCTSCRHPRQSVHESLQFQQSTLCRCHAASRHAVPCWHPVPVPRQERRRAWKLRWNASRHSADSWYDNKAVPTAWSFRCWCHEHWFPEQHVRLLHESAVPLLVLPFPPFLQSWSDGFCRPQWVFPERYGQFHAEPDRNRKA